MTGTRNGQAAHTGRIPSGRFRELGLINWIAAKLAARSMRVPEMHLFTTLGHRRALFWAWAIYGGRLLRGRLPAIDTELVILRVAHLRSCEYELQHHRRMGHRAGLDADDQAAVFAWPDITTDAGERLSDRQRALLNATDELVEDRTIGGATWRRLADYLDRRQLIEFCLLTTQYDGLAAAMSALDIPLDNPAG
ncbi:MAG: carboxymuconolactone decarboxylase family protein [Mycobacterium sp.]|nr:carboxymuconolactone decarboxylase family protein [Mycobacterium sp.]